MNMLMEIDYKMERDSEVMRVPINIFSNVGCLFLIF